MDGVDDPIDQFRQRLVSVGPVPVGSSELSPKYHHPSFGLMTLKAEKRALVR